MAPSARPPPPARPGVLWRLSRDAAAATPLTRAGRRGCDAVRRHLLGRCLLPAPGIKHADAGRPPAACSSPAMACC
jgi:hypothetical protein